MTIRLATSDPDQRACIALRIAVFVHEQRVPMAEELDGRDAIAHHILGGTAQMPLCAARIRLLDGAAKIERVCVVKSQRGTGLGARMMHFIHQHFANDPTVTLFKLEAQTYALPFYQKLGYTAHGSEFLDAGIPHYGMTRPV